MTGVGFRVRATQLTTVRTLRPRRPGQRDAGFNTLALCQRSQGRGRAVSAPLARRCSNSRPHSRQTWYVLRLIVNTRLSC